MKPLALTGMILLIGVASDAAAVSCEDDGFGDGPLNAGQTRGELNDKRVLATAPGGEEWNEDHCSNGNLFKVGDGTPVDPRAFRGTWDVVGGAPANRRVVYNYTVTGSSTFEWTLWRDSPGGSLCWGDPNNGNEVVATAPAPGSLTGTCDSP